MRPSHAMSTLDPAAVQPATYRRLWLASIAAAYVAVAWLVLRTIDKATWAQVSALPWTLFAALLALSALNYAVRSWRWVHLSALMTLGVPARDNVLFYLAGYALTATPGKAGEAVRLWLLRLGHGVTYARSLPLMLADRLLDMWAVLLLALGGLYGFAQYRWQGAMLAAVVVLVSLPALFANRFEPLIGLAGHWLPQRRRALVRVRRMLRAVQALRSWRGYGATLLPSIAGWLAEGAALYLLLAHLGANITLMQAVFVFSFGMIVGAISMLPGGLGSTELTMVALLTALGVGLDVALVATAIVRVTTFWFAVAIGAALMPLALARARVARAVGA